MPNIKPFRDYDEHDVINLFAYNYAGTAVQKGTFVKVASGWMSEDEMGFYSMPGATYPNTQSQRFGVKARVTAAGSGDNPIGMLLYDVRETDENGELLIYKPSKAAEMQTTVSGQAVPIITKGVFLYSGITNNPDPVGMPWLSVAAGGALTTGAFPGCPIVGRALGFKDSKGWCLIKVDC